MFFIARVYLFSFVLGNRVSSDCIFSNSSKKLEIRPGAKVGNRADDRDPTHLPLRVFPPKLNSPLSECATNYRGPYAPVTFSILPRNLDEPLLR